MGESAIVAEEFGRNAAAGPLVPTLAASALVAGAGAPTEIIRRLADGLPAAVSFSTATVVAESTGDGFTLRGSTEPVLGGGYARLLLLPVLVDGAEERWCVVELDDVAARHLAGIDGTRRAARFDLSGCSVAADHVLQGVTRSDVRAVGAVVFGAEAVGGASWCLETASEYAKVREQFGRPIGQFQAVKHRCADMLVRTEQARALVWDAAQAWGDDSFLVAAAAAGAVALDAHVDCAKDCIQVLGAIGYTWDHDAHLFLKRAISSRASIGGRFPFRVELGRLVLGGARRGFAVELPEDAEPTRQTVRSIIGSAAGMEAEPQHRYLVEEGLVCPHWPRPWGRSAGPIEQLVIDEEFRKAAVERPTVLQPQIMDAIIAFGTEDQQRRWVGPTLNGELRWCQLFSEPGAGSDLASLTAKAVRTERGWLLTGQKVWTTLAREADLGQCLARTEQTERKHDGITCFIIDMHADGVEIRPLRDITGDSLFNEVSLADVFVADEDVLGAPGAGWKITRSTLASERVMQGTRSSLGLGGLDELLAVVRSLDGEVDAAMLECVGSLAADSMSAAALAMRTVLRSLPGGEPGPESSVQKLLWVEHEQQVQQFALTLLGERGAAAEGDASAWAYGFLASRSLTIAGGTSEVQRNVIAERLLGLPRD